MTINSKYTSMYAGKFRRLFRKIFFSPTFKKANYYHFLRGEKGEDFMNKKGFSISAVEFLKIRLYDKFFFFF